MDRSREYVYLPLEDARKAIGVKVNLFGIVAEIGIPTKSKGSDYVVRLKILDQSYFTPGISVNFFARSVVSLPNVRSSGDIISLHLVMMKLHDGNLYCAFHKRFSSFALFLGRNDGDFSPYQASSNYHATDHDKEFILGLRKWFMDHESSAGLEAYLLQLRSMKTDRPFDLVCKVLYVCETSEGEGVLFVWDGTDTRPLSLEADLNTEVASSSSFHHAEVLPIPRDVLCKFPPVGTVLGINVGQFFKKIRQVERGDQWIKLCNVQCEVHSGMWKILLQNASKVRFLSAENQSVALLKRNYEERIGCKVQCQPITSFPRPSHITDTCYEHGAYATLRESLAHPEVNHKFKCIVRVIAAHPWQADQFRRPLDGQYRIRLTLEDPTARIHAYITGEDGVRFFDGYPSNEVVTNKMNQLLGVNNDPKEAGACPSRDPPWIWCCLKSYYLDKSDPWGSRRYCIFGTVLLGDSSSQAFPICRW